MIIFLVITCLLVFTGFFLSSRDKSAPDHSPFCLNDLSIVIPARDEAANLAKHLPNLPPDPETIVVDDNSTDATAATAEKHGAKVISGQPLPTNWRGKPWACQQGADAVTRPLLLFLDADVQASADGLKLLLKETTPGTLLSTCPYHQIEQPYENLSLFFHILMETGAQDDLYGQCLLATKSDYETLGGHRAIVTDTVDSIALARAARKAGLQTKTIPNTRLITMRMFPEGLAQLCQSWRKSFTQAAGTVPKRLLILSSCWLTGGMIATFMIPVAITSASPLFLVPYLLFAVSLWHLGRPLGNYRWWSYLFFPIPLFFYQALFFSSLRSKNKNWKGRNVS